MRVCVVVSVCVCGGGSVCVCGGGGVRAERYYLMGYFDDL